MTRVVLVSHGRLGEGLLATAATIVGEVQGVDTIALEAGMGVEELVTALKAITASTPARKGILLLVDLFGGSPSTACARLMAVDERIEVVTGVNLPMLLEVLLNQGERDAGELARLARQKGKEGIIDVRAALKDAAPSS